MTQQITIDELHSRLKAQKVSGRDHFAFKCVICGTVQSIASLNRAGCPADKAENQVGFSCEGRWSGIGPWPGAKNKTAKARARRKLRGCDWTLGGLFRLHNMEVIDADGEKYPIFDIATSDEAQSLERLMEWRERMDTFDAAALPGHDRGSEAS